MPRQAVNVKSRLFPESAWRKLGLEMITTPGTALGEANTIMDALLTGSLAGIDSHGVRNLPYFAKKHPRGRAQILKERVDTILMDAGGSWGPVYAKLAMRKTIEKAKKCGIASCSVTNGDWITNLFFYVLMTVQKDMIGMAFVRAPLPVHRTEEPSRSLEPTRWQYHSLLTKSTPWCWTLRLPL